MSDTVLAKLFEHNNWANDRIIEACKVLGDELLDAKPRSVTKGNIRATLIHLLEAQDHYSTQLIGEEPRLEWQTPPDFTEMTEAAEVSGQGLLDLAREERSESLDTTFQKGEYVITPWVVLVQTINHATEHREQIKSMMSSLGITPPDVDGWSYGNVTGAFGRISA